MNNNKILGQTVSCSLNRFSQILLLTQLVILAYALKINFLSIDSISQDLVLTSYNIRIDVLFLSACALIIPFILKKIYRKTPKKAFEGYFYFISIIASVIALIDGGLNSIALMNLPIIAVFSALCCRRKATLLICAYFCLLVILMATNMGYEEYSGTVSASDTRVFEFIFLMGASAVIAHLLSRYVTSTLSGLKQKYHQATESRKLIPHLANSDPLTGLASSTSAKASLKAMQVDLNSEYEEIGFYFVDIDNFKVINDLFDHELGDALLKIIATRLSRIIDTRGTVCRLGGDQFVLFIKVNKQFDHSELAKEILIAMSERHLILGTQAEITASIGITVINDHDISFDHARKQADMAMNKSKKSENNKYHFYSESLHRDYMKNLTILNALKDALSKNLFDLYYQPKIDIKTNQVVGTEALLRWNRENPNNLTPGDFIPVVESTELIHSIGAWVVEQACTACKQWHDNGHKITVAVNVSALQLAREGFFKVVENALKTSGLQPQFLEVELTEHFLIQESTTIKSQLQAIKKLGVKLAIDDFGTGYSNMGYLTRMEVDTLKLDRSFICNINKTPDSLAIVTAINQMAGVLGMNVVAEGIENEFELKVLKTIGCEIGQGYFWSKALSSSDLLSYLQLKTPAVYRVLN